MTRSRPWLLFITIALAAGVYLIGNGRVALWDRDEPRFAQTSRQMMQSGDWVVPHYLDHVRTAKPAFIYWCQATAMSVFGDNAFAARLPSATAIMLLLVVLSAVLWKPIGPRLTVWTVFIFATSGLTLAAAKMCITDGVLLLWVTIAQLCLYAFWRGNRSWPAVIAFSIAVGLAGLTKGPVILGFEATTLLALGAITLWDRWGAARRTEVAPALDRPPPDVPHHEPAVLPDRSEANQLTGLKIAVGLLMIVAIILPWVLMVNHRASQFLHAAVTHEVWDRMMTPLEQHSGRPGYYFIAIWATFYPWSLLLPLAMRLAWKHRAEPRVRFCLAAVVGPWLMLESVQTKLPHYFLPAFPPLAYLTADALIQCINGAVLGLRGIGFRIGVGVWALATALVALAPWLAVIASHAPLPLPAMTLVSVAGIAFAAVVATLLLRNRLVPAAVTMGLGTLLMVVLFVGPYLPNAQFLRLSPRIARVLIDHGVTRPHEVIMIDYEEPSLAFYQGGTMREPGPLGFSTRWLPQLPPWLVISKEVYDTGTPDVRDAYEIVASDYGLAYANKMRWMTVLVLKRKGITGTGQGAMGNAMTISPFIH